MNTPHIRSFLLALALAAVALPSFAAEPVNIARLQTTTIKSYDSSGTDLNGGGFGGGSPMGNMFDGNLSNGARATSIGNGGYVILDFGNPYFVSTIDVTKLYRYKYSLYYSPSLSGDDWIPVPYALNVNRVDTKQWGVYAVASRVKFVFEQGGSFVPDVTELQVWGVLASEMACLHSNLSTWTEVAGSATCTKPALEMATCSCGEKFTRESNGEPLGHSYKIKVTQPGKGFFSCRRCNFSIDCSDGPVDLTSHGGMAFDKKVQFVDMSVSSTRENEEYYGKSIANIVDNNLDSQWVSSSWRGGDADYVDFRLGTDVLLTKVEVTLPNQDTLRIYDYDGTKETKIFEEVMDAAPKTMTAEFSDLVTDAIRIRAFNNRYSFMYVSEVRVYGTVPGDVTPEPCFIFMQ